MNNTLQVGRTYANKAGKLVKIVAFSPELGDAFVDESGSQYDMYGYSHRNNWTEMYNLIIGQDVDISGTELRLECGKSYVNRIGETIKIIEKSRCPQYSYIGVKVASTGYKDRHAYTQQGASDVMKTIHDLVKEYNPNENGGNDSHQFGQINVIQRGNSRKLTCGVCKSELEYFPNVNIPKVIRDVPYFHNSRRGRFSVNYPELHYSMSCPVCSEPLFDRVEQACAK